MEGFASWYGRRFHGGRTASGERYDMHSMTAAHRTLPFNTWVRVTRLKTKQSVTVRINNRGPYVEGRIIDLSRQAASKLGMLRAGVSRVRLEVVRWGARTRHKQRPGVARRGRSRSSATQPHGRPHLPGPRTNLGPFGRRGPDLPEP